MCHMGGHAWFCFEVLFLIIALNVISSLCTAFPVQYLSVVNLAAGV